jgi:hypothetical protein
MLTEAVIISLIDRVLPSEINLIARFSVEPCIPFKSIYRDPVKMRGPLVKVFIPGQEIVVRIVKCERNATTRWQNPNV